MKKLGIAAIVIVGCAAIGGAAGAAGSSGNPVPSVDGGKPVATATSAPVVPAGPQQTVSQRSAVQSAKSYIDLGGFSRSGLIKQLEFEKFSAADSAYGADNSGANWTTEADQSAASYMEMGGFSAGSLMTQLKFEGFTATQAQHGVTSVGL